MIKTETIDIIDRYASFGREEPVWTTAENEYHCCDNDLNTCDDDVYDIDGCDYCTECAFNSIYTPERATEYINKSREMEIDFYLNFYCDCTLTYNDFDKISDSVLEMAVDAFEFEQRAYPSKTSALLLEFCEDDKQDFIESFGYKRYRDE